MKKKFEVPDYTKIDSFHASDYIGGSFGNAEYYYGYERSKCTECGKMNTGEYCNDCDDADREWCFEVTVDGKVVFVKTYSELGCIDMFALTSCFTRGMIAYLSEVT